MVAVIVLSPNGEKRILKTGQITGAPTGAAVAKAVRKTRPAEEVGRLSVSDGELLVWGWTEGKKGAENKHVLPGDLAGRVMYSDVVITYAIEKDLTMEVWEGVASATQREGIASATQPDTVAPVPKKAPASKKTEAPPPPPIDESDDDSESECSNEEEEDESEVEDVEASEEEEEEETEEEDVSEDEEEEEEEEDDDGSCNDEEDGGGKRRSARRRTAVLQEFRRMEMGLRSRVRFPATPGKRAPRWQTAPQLTKEEYVTTP